MTREIDAAYSTAPFFESLKNRWATQLYKYSRSEIFRLGWNIDSSSGLHLDDEEMRDATTIATRCIVLLAGKFLGGQGHSADCEQIQTLGGFALQLHRNLSISRTACLSQRLLPKPITSRPCLRI